MEIRTDIRCRKANRADMPKIYELVKDLAVYEESLDQLKMDLDGYYTNWDDGTFESIVAEKDGEILGTCIYYMTFSTWRGKMLYLEDFVVKEKLRGQGVGQVLWNAYIQESKDRGCAMVKWQVLDWNTPAVNFYEKNGATIEKEWWNGKIIF